MMITVKQAHKLILKNTRRLPARKSSLARVCGQILAEDVRSSIALPLWNNSAMDGFVLRFQDTMKASANTPTQLQIKGVIKAGDTKKHVLKSGETMRIMTGAVIPAGGNAVVAQENVSTEGMILKIEKKIRPWNHIRLKGEDVCRGVTFKMKNTIATSGTVAFLSSLGKGSAKVYLKPKVSVIATGNELVKAGNKLKTGQIYESNSVMLAASLEQAGFKPLLVENVKDDRRRIKALLKKALAASDTIILAGGVSVGDYDYSKEVLAELGVKTIFWKVAQKPGKPIYMGKLKNKLIFGLPGNPASAFICFYEYVLPALRIQMGHAQPFLPRYLARIQAASKSVKRDSLKTLFLKARYTHGEDGGKVVLLSNQGSHMVSSLHATNAVAVIEPGKTLLRQGAKIAVDVLGLSETGTIQ